MAEESEVLIELEALEAMYGDDCVVIDSFPPHLHLHIMPRTADVSSQQFVEAVIRIKACPQYPNKPPQVEFIESKGLDGVRQKQLMTTLRDKACELSSCLMLVALCEEAIEKLTVMNHPDGNCPLCLSPLVSEDGENETLPFMKLMSCFHCFHSECIVQWWNWLQKEKEKESNASNSSATTLQQTRDAESQSDTHGIMEEGIGNCPVCRKVFHSKDLEHVLNLVGAHSPQSISNRMDVVDDDDEKLLQSDSENFRRQKFEAILKLQQENNGLIEPKKDLLVLPGMFLPQPTTTPSQRLSEEATELHPTVPVETSSATSSTRPIPVEVRNSGRRRQRVYNSRRQTRQWVSKERTTK